MNSRVGNRILVSAIFFISFFTSTFVYSTPSDSSRFKVGVLPSIFYTPETRLGFGGMFYSYFKLCKNDTVTKKSNSQSYFSYTLNKQFSIENDYQIWLKGNKFYSAGAFDYSRFPQFYYGIGNNTKDNDRIMMSFDVIKIQAKNLARISNMIYGGFLFQYQRVYNQDIELMPTPTCMEIYGNRGYEAKGIGPVLMIDKRDNPLNPAKGFYIEASYVDYKNIITNTNMFSSFTFDARKFHTFNKKLISNSNLYLSFNKGNVPYRMLPEIGGARFLRGYYRGRFRDNNMVILQQEFRMPIYKAFGLAVFGGCGEVANTLPQLRSNEIHYNYGIGLRLRVNKKENTNIRIDYGFTKDSQGLYIVFAEAF